MDEEKDPFFSFWHYCPVCGAYIDDGTSDGKCFDCLEAEELNKYLAETKATYNT